MCVCVQAYTSVAKIDTNQTIILPIEMHRFALESANSSDEKTHDAMIKHFLFIFIQMQSSFTWPVIMNAATE